MKFKIYDRDGNRVADAVDATFAAMVVSVVDGGAVRHGRHGIIWNKTGDENSEEIGFDVAADTMNARIASVDEIALRKAEERIERAQRAKDRLTGNRVADDVTEEAAALGLTEDPFPDGDPNA